jgi:hypothetical protein
LRGPLHEGGNRSMTDPAQNAALIRRFYDEVFNAGHVDFAL